MNRHVVLFFPALFPVRDQGAIAQRTRKDCIPLSLLTIAGPLVEQGYDVKIITQSLEPRWRQELIGSLRQGAVCVGISAMTGNQLTQALEASKIVKQNSSVPVVWGGIHPTILPAQTIQNPLIDIVVEGEGEETFLELVMALEERSELSSISGLWYKNNGRIIQNPSRAFIDLNKQPPLPYKLLGNQDIRTLHIFTARGCPHNCSYCYNPTVNKGTWRALNSEEAIRRIGLVRPEFKNLEHIYFIDDNFFVDQERARTIIGSLLKFGIPWSTHIRIDTLAQLDDDFLALLDKSLCHHLLIGMESGSEKILELMQKKINLDEVIITNKKISRYSFIPVYNFVLGIPTEIKKDIQKTFQLIERLLADNPKAVKNLNIFAPYPGNPLFDLAVTHGFQPPEKLEDWSRLNIKNVALKAWLSKEMKEILTMLLFCSPFLDLDRQYSRKLTLLRKAAVKLYRPLARLRIRKLYTCFGLEILLGKKLGYEG